MRRRLFLPLLLIALSTSLPGASAASKVVETLDNKFSPVDIAATVGDTIVFRNTGEAPHNAQADDGSFKIAIINPGAEEKVIVSKAGTISYVCSFHKSVGMKGTIVVNEAAGAPPAGTAKQSQGASAEGAAGNAAPESATEEDDAESAAEAPEPVAAIPPSEKYFPILAVGLLVLLLGALGLGYLRFILKAAQKQT